MCAHPVERSAAAEISGRERLVRAGLKKKENPQKERKIKRNRMPGLSGQETMRQFTQLLAAMGSVLSFYRPASGRAASSVRWGFSPVFLATLRLSRKALLRIGYGLISA
jgi:hypothetical protein